MRLKVDENIGTSGVHLLRQAGHDAMTVRDQSLAGATDERIFQACVAERRTLITLDRDFGEIDADYLPRIDMAAKHIGAVALSAAPVRDAQGSASYLFDQP